MWYLNVVCEHLYWIHYISGDTPTPLRPFPNRSLDNEVFLSLPYEVYAGAVTLSSIYIISSTINRNENIFFYRKALCGHCKPPLAGSLMGDACRRLHE